MVLKIRGLNSDSQEKKNKKTDDLTGAFKIEFELENARFPRWSLLVNG